MLPRTGGWSQTERIRAVHDLALDTLQVALDGLSARQRVIADNLANIETPRFLAGRVDFETSLREAVDEGSPRRMQLSTSRSTDPTLPNGNNVRLDEESIAMAETELRYQLAAEGVNAKYRLLRSAIGNSA